MSVLDYNLLKQGNDLATQVSKTYSSNINDIGSTVSNAFTPLTTGLTDALSNLNSAASKLGAGGFSKLGSLDGALSFVSSLGSASKFNDTFVPPSKLKDLTPEETRNQPLTGYTFPEDIGKYFITFTFVEYNRKVPLFERKSLPKAIINLPIPANLSEQFGMSYADKQLGIAGYLSNTIATAIGGGSKESFAKAGEQLGKDITSKEGIYYGGRTLTGLSDNLGSAIDKATGTVLNPFQSLLFQGVNMRQHQFTFKLSPNSERESMILKDIIKTFKMRMHPYKDNLLYHFPDLCEISFGSPDEPYKFKQCFLETMSVNYAPNGTPAFFAKTNQPVEVEISLTFKEVEPITRDFFE